jgi:ubiquinone/menaquinone biosynthesis C-methylase UbiE
MQLRELAEMHEVEVDHWWFAGKRILFKRLLAERLARPSLRMLDVGSGTGAVPQDFSSFGWMCASDRSLDAMRFARGRGVSDVMVCDASALPIADASIDLVLAFDVVEHVDDDRAMLAELARVVRPGGAVAIHVPAWPSLWSRHDEVLEHKRRYTRRALRKLIDDSGLQLEYLGWASASILPAAFLLRMLRRDGAHEDDVGGADIASLPEPLNTIARGVYHVEAAVAATTGLPFGLSLAAIATC